MPVAQAPMVSGATRYHASSLEALPSATDHLRSAVVPKSTGRTLTPICRYGIEIIGRVDTWHAGDVTRVWTKGAVQLRDVEEGVHNAIPRVWEPGDTLPGVFSTIRKLILRPPT